ncbi:class I SAM-dependent methyltransferase [Numidum massiliense]|uniref:class I SAM-dependent methyltransferase n=1 Tax=Numidum massiliense TaxID=1522315 RepID=UPI00164DECFF|nr:class I SAM-dependent methyltransferase [Numidum massiliense]
MTTSYRVTPQFEQEARAFAAAWGWPYEQRKKYSLPQIRARFGTEELIVLSASGARWVGVDEAFTYHPSLSVVRIKRLLRGEGDVFYDIVGLRAGDSWLDATCGFAADAITAAHIVGRSGTVVGLESEKRIAAVVAYGLTHYPTAVPEVAEAMQRVRIRAVDHLSYLRKCPNNAYDFVYFDPMFRRGVTQSAHMNPLRHLADDRPLSEEAVREARRVARRAVILKETVASGEFTRLGFELLTKKTDGVCYGII